MVLRAGQGVILGEQHRAYILGMYHEATESIPNEYLIRAPL